MSTLMSGDQNNPRKQCVSVELHLKVAQVLVQ